MALLVAGISSYHNNFEYRSNIHKVTGIELHSDFSNIKIISTHPDLSIDFKGQETMFGKPSIDIAYDKDKAIINVLTFDKGWKKILPGKRQRGHIVLNIPPGSLSEIQLETKNGDIEVDQVMEASQLSLISDVGRISMNSFQGKHLNVEAGNGSVHLGEVDGQINIKNKVGSLKSLNLRSVKGENHIKISNGNVNLQLPDNIDEVGLNISTKNGKITSKQHDLNIVSKGPGKEAIKLTPREAKLDISVTVGSIELR